MKSVTGMLAIAALLLVGTATVSAAELQVGASDSIESVLAAQKGQRVSVRVSSGQELTGVVRMVNARVVQLGGLSGREFFDAVVPLTAVEAVMVRVRDR